MDESLYTRDNSKNKGPTQREMTHADKLMNKESAKKYYGEKFRQERSKKDTSEKTPEDIRHEKVKKQTVNAEKTRRQKDSAKKAEQKAARERTKAGITEAASRVGVAASIVSDISGANSEDQNKDESSVAEEAFDTGGYIASGAVSHVTSKIKHSKYSNKLHQGKDTEAAAEKAAKERMKKEMQRKAAAKNAKAAENTGKIGRKITDKAEDLLALLAEKVQEFVMDNPVISIIIVAILILILAFSGLMNSCSALGAGGGDITVATSFTAKDEDILETENDYKELEEGLMDEVDEIAEDHADYDEVNYHLDEVGHNPYQLAAILTVIFESYTRDEVQDKLQEIFELQYEITYEETVETREREVEDTRWVEDDSYAEGGYWEDYTYTEEYEYYICDIYLVNHGLDHVVEELGFTDDEIARYEILLETFGNKKYLFGEDDIYSIPGAGPGDYDDYHVPGEYLSDEEFARMLHEAEKYLGVSYVWGGYSPDGFDCSGFVSYVINHCGNGWNVGRQTANGLRAITGNVPASEAKPGDLIFFQGTYDTSGASHVGIYVGNGMMLHAGNPIHYSSINTPYWQSHYLGFGRLP